MATASTVSNTASREARPHPARVRSLEQLVGVVHDELRRIAHRQMRNERHGHTLQTTALVNEAYLRLRELHRIDWHDRRHFLSVAARIMRRILVDRARAVRAEKRGGEAIRVTLDDNFIGDDDGLDLIALDQALNRLAACNEIQARIVELRYFSGLSVAETAAVLDFSPASIKRKWTLARAWLYRELTAAA
jgi:RNA polymerase sigma factor (TIGR02999 family)